MKRCLAVLGLILAAMLIVGCGSASSPKHVQHALPTGAHSGHRPAWDLVHPPARFAVSTTAPVPVPAHPSGPSGSYKPVFADGFGSLAAWNIMVTKSGSRGCCNNSGEIGDMVAAEVRQIVGLLELLCTHETSSLGRPYSCSGVASNFRWQPGHGQTMIFEVEAQWPSNAGQGQDAGWWSTDGPWTDEIDFFEQWGWGHLESYSGIPCWLPKAGAGSDYCHEIYKAKTELNGPETSFHKYTTVIKPNGEAEEWVDGAHRWNLGPITGINTPWMHLILTHAMRGSSTSGTTSFAIKRVEVWEDEAHAGQFLENAPSGGAVAGTCISGASGCGEPAPAPEPTTTTETTPAPPPPPAPEKPAAPTGVTASSISTSTSPGVAIKWSAVSGATSYKLYRVGNENIEGRKPGEQWGGALSSTSASNHQLITAGGRYCYYVAAINAQGQGPFSPITQQSCAFA